MKRATVGILLLLTFVGCSGRNSTVGPTSVSTSGLGLSGNLAFGSVTVGATATATLTITNTGSAPVTVSGITYPPGFSGPWSGSIPAGGSQPVTVTFAPTVATLYTGTLTVLSDTAGGSTTIAVSGTGTATAPLSYVGTWLGTYTIAGVSGGECVGGLYEKLVGPPLAFVMTVAQNGNTLSATATDPGSTLSSSYTGSAALSSTTALYSVGPQPTVVPVTCAQDIVRDVQFASGLINWTVTGDHASTGTITANYNVFIHGTQTNVGTMIITAEFNVTR